MRRYLPCVVFAVVVCTASARPQVPLGQDPFGASSPVGGNFGGIPLSAVSGGEIPLPTLDAAVSAGDSGVFGPSDFGSVGLAFLDDPFAGTGGLASLGDPFAGTGGLASLDDTFVGTGGLASLDDPFAGTGDFASFGDPFGGAGFANDLTFTPEAAPVLPFALAAAPAATPAFTPAPAQDFSPAPGQAFAPAFAHDFSLAPAPAFAPAPAQVNNPFLLIGSDPVLAPSSPDIANEILSGPVFVPLPAQVSAPASAPFSDPILAPSSPDIANEILSGPVFVPLPAQESDLRTGSIAFPAGAPTYNYPAPSICPGFDCSSDTAAVATPGITMITKANLVYTAFDVAEVNHARDAALAAAVAGNTGAITSVAPVAPAGPADPRSVVADNTGAERAVPNYSISIDPVLLSDVAGYPAPAAISAPVPAPAPVGIYSGPTQ